MHPALTLLLVVVGDTFIIKKPPQRERTLFMPHTSHRDRKMSGDYLNARIMDEDNKRRYQRDNKEERYQRGWQEQEIIGINNVQRELGSWSSVPPPMNPVYVQHLKWRALDTESNKVINAFYAGHPSWLDHGNYDPDTRNQLRAIDAQKKAVAKYTLALQREEELRATTGSIPHSVLVTQANREMEQKLMNFTELNQAIQEKPHVINPEALDALNDHHSRQMQAIEHEMQRPHVLDDPMVAAGLSQQHQYHQQELGRLSGS